MRSTCSVVLRMDRLGTNRPRRERAVVYQSAHIGMIHLIHTSSPLLTNPTPLRHRPGEDHDNKSMR